MRSGQYDREVSMAEYARWHAMTEQAVGQLANIAPPELVRAKGRRRMLVMPGFALFHRAHVQRERKKTVSSLDELRKRQAEIDVELSELELAAKRGDLVSVEEFDRELVATLSRLRATMLNLPNRFAARTVGLDSLRQSQVVWDQAIREALKILATQDDTEQEVM
jgi:hypothetical protein